MFVDRRGKQRWISTRKKGVRTGANLNEARRVLADCESDTNKGLPVSAGVGQLPFKDALQDVVNDQEANGRRAVDATKRRLTLHIQPFFEGFRIGEITTTQIRAYVAHGRASHTKPNRRRSIASSPSSAARSDSPTVPVTS